MGFQYEHRGRFCVHSAAADGLNNATPTDTYSDQTVGVRYTYRGTGTISNVRANGYILYKNNNEWVTAVDQGDTLAEYTYDTDGNLTGAAYGNGQSVGYTYVNGKPTAFYIGNTAAATYTYGADGALTQKTDAVNGTQTDYTASSETISEAGQNNTLTEIYRREIQYLEILPQEVGTIGSSYLEWEEDEKENANTCRVTESFAGQTYKTDYQENIITYGMITRTQTVTDNQVTGVTVKNGAINLLSSAYTYNEETGQIATVTNTYGNTADTRTYAYNDEGKLTSVTRGNQTTQYFYDLSGQLVRVNDPANNQTVVVGYQGVSGNIASVTTYPYTTDETILATGTTVNYTYGDADRGDLLTNFNGNAMTYDAFGNLQSYNGFTYTWQAGRRLTGMTDGVNNTYAYQYDDNGIRTQKTVNSTTTRYTAVDGRITGQYDGTNTLYFRYDEADSLIGFNLNGTEYVYLKNMQGDIEGILDNSGNVVVQYAYNAWGKVLSCTGTLASTVGAINPMRYRGYYQDGETGYYYLQSRYYDPEIGRFINADEPGMLSISLDDIVGVNLYTYCNNDPVNFVDPTGHISISVIVAKLATKAIALTLRLSIAMYLYAISGSHFKSELDLSDWYDPLGILMRNRLKNSKFIMEYIKEMIRKRIWKKSIDIYFGDSGGNVSDLDLSMSVGHVSISFSITKTNKKQFIWFGKTKYIVTLSFWDKYDFRLFRKNDAGLIKRAINNYIGYYPQEWKILKIYTYSITYTFDYYY